MTVTNTLTQFSEIQSVEIKIEGETYTSPLGFVSEMFNKSPKGDNKVVRKISLYFAGSNADQLINEIRSVKLASDEKIEERIVKELIKGPTGEGLHKTIPVNSRLINVDVNNDLALVNLSESFVEDHWGGSTGELMTIYSIVNSLTDLAHIRRVKFLIDGEEKTVFSHYSFNEIFERDESLISK
jgi:germination protein M